MLASLHNRPITAIKDLENEEIKIILLNAGLYKDGRLRTDRSDKVVGLLFFEASTRTRYSFECAIKRLRGKVLCFQDNKETSSLSKGESIEDTVRMFKGYCDGLVIRHPESGFVDKMVEMFPKYPIINGGDGVGEHPTQSLLDLFTICESFELCFVDKADEMIPIYKNLGAKTNKSTPAINIVFVGDLLNGRTVHSLAQLLCRLAGVKLTFVAPHGLEMPKKYIETILPDLRKKSGVPDSAIHQPFIQESNELSPGLLERADVLYMTRIQWERIKADNEQKWTVEDCAKIATQFQVTAQLLDKYCKDTCIVMHPLPRLQEIDVSVDTNKRQRYFEQAENGLYVRMSLLHCLLP